MWWKEQGLLIIREKTKVLTADLLQGQVCLACPLLVLRQPASAFLMAA